MVENRELLDLFAKVLKKMKKAWAKQLEHGLNPS